MKLPVAKPRPDIENFIKVVKGEVIAERPPLVELLIDKEIIKAIGQSALDLNWVEPGADRQSRQRYWDFYVKVHEALGYDYVLVWGVLKFPSAVRVSADTAQLARGNREWAETSGGLIKDWGDLERYQWPIFSDECLSEYEYVSSILPDGMGMFVCNGDGFLEIVSDFLFGYERMCYLLYDEPALVEAAIERVGKILVDAHKKMLEIPKVAGIFIGDDMGFNSSTLFSKDFLVKSILPWHKKLAELAHSKDLLYMLHSCGNIDSIMDDLIDDVKIDAKHSFEDKCSSIFSFKATYGSRVAALGGVDIDKLCRLEETELRCYIRRILDACADGGKYAFGSGNSIANYVPVENYLIMLEEGYNY